MTASLLQSLGTLQSFITAVVWVLCIGFVLNLMIRAKVRKYL